MNPPSKNVNKLRKEFSELSALSKLSEMMSSDITLSEFLEYCVSSLTRELDAQGAGLFLSDNDNGHFTVKTRIGLCDDTVADIHSGTDPLVKWVMEVHEPLLIIDELMDPRVREENIKSIIVSPLKIKNRVIGIFYLTRTRPGDNFTAIDQELVTIFAAQAAFAIENSRLYRMTQEKIRELNKLNKIGKMLTSSFDIDHILKIIVNTIKDMINIEFGALLLLGEEKLNITLVVPSNINDSTVDEFEATMVETMKILTMEEVQMVKTKVIYNENYDWSDQESRGPTSIESLLSVPLIVRGTVQGILNVAHSQENFYTKDNLRTISNFATQISMALENAKAYMEMEDKFKEQGLLMEVSKALTSTLDLDRILKLVVKITADLLKVKTCALRLYDKKTCEFTVRASIGLTDHLLRQTSLKKGEGIIGKVFETGAPVAISDISKSPDFKHYEILRSEGIVSMLAVPISIKDQIIGVLNVYATQRRWFTDNEINLLSTIGLQAAAAIENARLYTFMHENFMNTIKALSAAIDTKDHYTHGHSKNVMDFSALIAQEMGMTPIEVELIRFAGLLHDIGKIGVSESILSKKSGLTDEEFAIISTHPKLGTMIMDSVDFLKKISPITYHHHERWDGKGYPMGLKGEDIPLGSRIISVADAFDAITSKRSYSGSKTDDFGISEVCRCSGTQFDPAVVEAFASVMEKRKSGLLKIDEAPFLLTEQLMRELS
ncbi:MAG: hypothetical protein CVV64_08575 [Candidatus Wallbacteria bacterium HGW-Wallbacteria-1]|jgi:putative nucleotidyltransferase with HDIG domain|uniref:HD-GYP domain-containing protein n=1 Tax=Candidatus Wallbacteria bacterium HGW-Wallbacteria-1 TaxID=2013854 RepID=A0A2N1PPZ7_9BACT|nr:MAG: hypothetical protein CVV64_08575 [Candidatus Wallbacteria bacterium HGW-Wallbacteria-1]